MTLIDLVFLVFGVMFFFSVVVNTVAGALNGGLGSIIVLIVVGFMGWSFISWTIAH